MFSKILIANRGEIACRVVATARKLGVATVAVYSDADAQAKHVEMADQAVRIGPAPVAESYLKGDVIIQAALDTGAQAIHPGYGFLSENPDFVEQVQAAGLVFIGPPASAIKDMGLKDAAKALMEKANVPVVPGFHGNSQDPDKLANEASSIGYPVLIKARAGGGGKGMRLVERPGDFKTALEAAQREGQASFGDPHCLIEKYITHPRHIEIQVFADAQGNVVHLFERDCSLRDGKSCGRGRARDRVSGRWHCRVHRRRVKRTARGRFLVHGDEHTVASRASRHRSHYGARLG